jgi:hypothetical protein
MKNALCFAFLLTLVGCANPRPSTTTESVAQDKSDVLPSQESAKPSLEGDHQVASTENGDQPGNAYEQIAPPMPSIRDDFVANPKIWELIFDTDGIKTYREINPAGDIVSFRGEALLRASIENLAAVLNTPELRKEWVDSLVDTHTIEKRSVFDRIEYVRSKVPWPFHDRDFVFRVQVRVTQSPYSVYIKMNSVDDQREPPRLGIVRGILLHAHYFLRDASTSQGPATEVVVEIAADPKGSIPSWIVNLVQKNWPNNTLRALEKVSTRRDLFIAPEIKDFFTGLARVP